VSHGELEELLTVEEVGFDHHQQVNAIVRPLDGHFGFGGCHAFAFLPFAGLFVGTGIAFAGLCGIGGVLSMRRSTSSSSGKGALGDFFEFIG
jgi:hypothetical protein